jgi:Leucine-rich repeat (LRR) protein
VGLTSYGAKFIGADLKQIASLTTLESLGIYGEVRATEEEWSPLADLSRLRHLTLCLSTTEGALRPLTGLTRLETIELHWTKSADVGLAPLLAPLKDFRSLRRLNLAGTPVGDASLAHVGALAGLEELDLESNKISDAGLAESLRGLTKLRSLRLYQLGPKGAAALKNLTRLESLAVERLVFGSDVVDLSGLASVKSLSIGVGNDAPMGAVRFPPRLEHLDVNLDEPPPGGKLNMGQPLPKSLKSIYLFLSADWMGDDRPPADLGWLAALPELREVTLWGAVGKEIRAVAGLERLSALTVTGICTGGFFGDEQMERLTALKQLTSLVIDRNLVSVTDAGMAELGEFPRLRRLELTYLPDITAAGLAPIWKMSGLEVLSLWLPGATPDGSVEKALAGISALTSLQELTLQGKVTDKTLSNLAQLKKLRRLDLSGCQGYTDEGLAALVKSLPELKEVRWSYRPAPAQ